VILPRVDTGLVKYAIAKEKGFVPIPKARLETPIILFNPPVAKGGQEGFKLSS
jgi:hypothetical protein